MRISTGRLELDWSAPQPPERGNHVAMHGQIDERADLASFARNLSDSVTIDLEKITFINSIGVREWIRMLRSFEARGVAVTLRRCSEAMVHQMNMLPEMQTGAVVESFFAPFLCEDCGHEASRCLELEQHLPSLRRMQPPEMPCTDCGATMQFNEIPGRYLLFLAHHAARPQAEPPRPSARR